MFNSFSRRECPLDWEDRFLQWTPWCRFFSLECCSTSCNFGPAFRSAFLRVVVWAAHGLPFLLPLFTCCDLFVFKLRGDGSSSESDCLRCHALARVFSLCTTCQTVFRFPAPVPSFFRAGPVPRFLFAMEPVFLGPSARLSSGTPPC